MKQEFLNFIDELMKASPELTEKLMTENIQAYLDVLREQKDTKPLVTDNGKVILKFLQDNVDVKLWKSKDLAEQIGLSSRCVSGTLRKLVNDGFCDKLGASPIIYCLTEKGKNYKIVIEENNDM